MFPLVLSKKAIEDIQQLKKENVKLPSKVFELIFDIFKHPFVGLGKPEPLKGNLSGLWSRRITAKHRLVYQIIQKELQVLSCYGHYDD